ncbi:uncharacterized protein BBA_10286 [Beauveria bassiana ARSEF 2860]|uniref:Uncharacterized protein n=1 Tax=Beauveria bassiana (strain ARSEF 2860) TaxID=655819 RepID=J5J9K8_BEAB2|nr:uncharacterized protein BBA_10286 [Beauveria bassiana ARSEF 2860]EJP60766.1 hypothetical protein BBA_10286 [Beauveria bassiana ARSEF 2860]
MQCMTAPNNAGTWGVLTTLGWVVLKSWENGSFWYFKAATIPKGAYNIFNCNIQPIFNKNHPNQSIFDKVFFFYWGQQASSFVEKKVNERNDYIKDLKEAFA